MYGDWPRKAVLVCRSRQALALTCGSLSRLEPCHFMLSQSHSEELDLRRRFCLGVGCSLCMQLNLCIFSGQKMLTCLRVHSIRGRGNGTRWRRWMTWTLRGRTRLSCWGAALCSGATAAATGGPLRTCARTGARAVVTRAAQYLLSVLPICHIKGAHANHSVGQCAWGCLHARICCLYRPLQCCLPVLHGSYTADMLDRCHVLAQEGAALRGQR